jgi:hypothetical protein
MQQEDYFGGPESPNEMMTPGKGLLRPVAIKQSMAPSSAAWARADQDGFARNIGLPNVNECLGRKDDAGTV